MNILRLSAVAAVALAALSSSAFAASPHRPSAVPPGYVVTPYGYFHPTCVVHLMKGDELRPDKGVVRHATGMTSAMHVCPFAHYRADGERVIGDERGIKNPDISYAWIEDASLKTANPNNSFGYLSAEWTVPPQPVSHDGQTLYLFIGLEDVDDIATILQPVLGWNADYYENYGIASWNCCEAGTAYEATPALVSPGDTILGYLYNTCAVGVTNCGSWDVVAEDLQNGAASELLDTSNYGQIFNWAFGGVVEVYNIVQCSDFPADPSDTALSGVAFDKIRLYSDALVQRPRPRWTVTNLSAGLTPQCSFGGSVPPQVELTY
jgi:hypothetical protein